MGGSGKEKKKEVPCMKFPVALPEPFQPFISLHKMSLSGGFVCFVLFSGISIPEFSGTLFCSLDLRKKDISQQGAEQGPGGCQGLD